MIVSRTVHLLARYLHTLRYLRAEQIYGRVWFRLYTPSPDHRPALALRTGAGTWQQPAKRRVSLSSPTCCRFLNEERDIGSAAAWDDPSCDKLWLYNLHYFDDLNAEGAAGRSAWHTALIERWISENPPGEGTGWEPYPTSLRIVNWIKWALGGNAMCAEWQGSLAVQARWLAKRLEWHLLGNHLFANAKALIFAGCYFDGAEAATWLAKGLRILERELPEQVLPDGGQFERSPMYHALAFEDVLDLINLFAAFPNAVPERWQGLVSSLPELATRMHRPLAVMRHPDGDIALFNDAAMGIAPSCRELEGYTVRLRLPALSALTDGVVRLRDSGYLRVQRGECVAFLDVAPIGPEYLPGHAHADTLSFELSLFGRRVLVNSGTSVYGTGPERQRQRGTAAHTTVTLDGADSSEVWAGFRVARRARPFGLQVDDVGEVWCVACSHDGYRRLTGKPVHRRVWRFGQGSLSVMDTVEGPFREAVLRPSVVESARTRSSLRVSGRSKEVFLSHGETIQG
ncbi:heparinase II/III family protein [Methylotetracoccus oryzae]|uniref:heparinase II/III family protein n=1 Tax=Methylotetracoccus oryzae TaxID=1919059 RepID=UPI00191364D7|nr:heparinase II/III family protein [Methylotetracoccus oryzae]